LVLSPPFSNQAFHRASKDKLAGKDFLFRFVTFISFQHLANDDLCCSATHPFDRLADRGYSRNDLFQIIKANQGYIIGKLFSHGLKASQKPQERVSARCKYCCGWVKKTQELYRTVKTPLAGEKGDDVVGDRNVFFSEKSPFFQETLICFETFSVVNLSQISTNEPNFSMTEVKEVLHCNEG